MKFTPSRVLALTALSSPVLVHCDSIAANSWGPGRIDLFGPDSNGDVWHKYYTGYGWEPTTGPGNLEIFGDAQADSPVSIASWGVNRENFVFIDTDGTVRHKYWTGSEWGPSGSNYEDLGRGPKGKLSINSWGADRLDIVGRAKNGSCLHKAWTGSSWYPAVDQWEDFGGDLASDPVVVSSSTGRLDIFGVSKEGNLSHKYWDGSSWNPEGKKWEDLGGKNFSGNIAASSPSPGRVDVWAIGSQDGALYHLFWEPYSFQWIGWESLGGKNFTNAPQVVHWGSNRIDILGREGGKEGKYAYKYWDGSQWSKWEKKEGKFASEPALVTLGENNLSLFGIDTGGKLLLQVWDGSQWLPSAITWYQLGDTNLASNGQLLTTQRGNFRFSREKGNTRA